jgi:hypothetical protein
MRVRGSANGRQAARLISLLLTDNSDPILSRDHCLQPWYKARHLILALLLTLIISADPKDFQSVLRGAQIEVRCDNERAHQDQASDSCHREPPPLQECEMRRPYPAIAYWAWCRLASQPAKGDDLLRRGGSHLLFLVVVPRVDETPAGHILRFPLQATSNSAQVTSHPLGANQNC